ncbi:MAG: histidinol-phosphatase [FCB group bacterium]|jgi:histidinol-phosphatase (PHP family)|nr:histidinol-phosphatase [FCB group bacterium]
MHVPWKVSLHGGHSGEFCKHAQGTLRDILDAAVAYGYHTFGVTEHAPRAEMRFLYPEEIALGYDPARLHAEFDAYARETETVVREYEGRLEVLRGFEIEVVPHDRYVEPMLELRRRHAFDYVVGSVHHVDDIPIDGPKEDFDSALRRFGSLESLTLRYFEQVTEMIRAIRPEVVGHLDLIRKNAPRDFPLDTPPIRRAAEAALVAAKDCGAVLDLNTAGYRKGLGSPYPAPWIVRLAAEMGLDFCFGDDSHCAADVGAGVDEARRYLLDNGVTSIAYWTRGPDGLRLASAPLDSQPSGG